jgi:ABC-type dipeptide/oligopeptide/nickel transport system ATPase component
MALLEVDDLRTYFKTRAGEVHAVDGVSFAVDRGKTLGIVGESGCGKSVTALSIMGLLPPSGRTVSGSIRFEGRELTGMSQHELEDIRGRQIAMIFQDPMTSLNPTLTIGRQIVETMQRHLDLSRDDARKRDRAARRGAHPERTATARRLSAPVLRRHATTCDDRDRVVVQPEVADRG